MKTIQVGTVRDYDLEKAGVLQHKLIFYITSFAFCSYTDGDLAAISEGWWAARFEQSQKSQNQKETSLMRPSLIDGVQLFSSKYTQLLERCVRALQLLPVWLFLGHIWATCCEEGKIRAVVLQGAASPWNPPNEIARYTVKEELTPLIGSFPC